MKYEIHIGKKFGEKPKQKIIITQAQFIIIERFAHTRKDENLNIIYKLNDIEFKVVPHLGLTNEVHGE
jgi:hypothetical protein